MHEIGSESQTKIEKREKAEAEMERARRREVFRSYELDEEDIARTRAIEAGDPVGSYFGFPEIQAQMIADEKAYRNGLAGRIERVVQAVGEVIKVPMLK